MLKWARARQDLGKIRVAGKGGVDFCVAVNRYASTCYEKQKIRLGFRDAEVARSNRVAPIRVLP